MRVVTPGRDQAFEDEMETRKGAIGLKDMLNSKDDSGTTLFQNLLETAKNTPEKAARYLSSYISENSE